MATARAQAISGTGVRVKEYRSNGREVLTLNTPGSYERFLSEEDDEMPLTWLKRIVSRAIWTQRFFWVPATVLLLIDAMMTLIVVLAVKYTEIDFATYMQQASVFVDGQREYHLISGDTGPCVYPALHLYLSSALSSLTHGGKDIVAAQTVYVVLYLATELVVMAIYREARIPPALLPLLVISKRLHSIYVLRLFNDCWAMFFLYTSVILMCRRKWSLASIFYSLALGVKMNILLFAPAMCAIYYRALGLRRSLLEGTVVIGIQVTMAMPFLLRNPQSYMRSAFNLSREFLFKWTVNLRFVDEKLFLDRRFSALLLSFHIGLVIFWLSTRWTTIHRNGLDWIRIHFRGTPEGKKIPSPRYIVATLFVCNLIGITFARSLHYQFYSWYAHQVPLLVYLAKLPLFVRILLPLAIESAWNTYPATKLSSLILLLAHLIMLAGLYASKADDAFADDFRVDEKDLDRQMASRYARKTRST